MRLGACLGGLLPDSNRSVRLIPNGAACYPENTEHNVGQIWEIQFHEPATITPPHTEDIIVTNQRLLGMQPDLRAFLQARVAPHPGNPARLYNGMIRFTGAGSGYISADAGVPGYSTCYWLPDRQLRRADDYFVYRYENGRTVRFKYVGYQNVQELIPAGTLLRMSLARWWTPDNDPDFEQRCYVQLSGWF